MKYEEWGQIDPRRKRLTSESPALLGLKKKFEMLRELVQDKLDILLISETKVDQSFPSSQLVLKGFSSPFRLDRNSSGCDIMLFVMGQNS